MEQNKRSAIKMAGKIDPKSFSINLKTKDQKIDELLAKDQLSNDEINELLKARKEGLAKFYLVDLREPMEYKYVRIKGVDFFVPTSAFGEAINSIAHLLDETIIVYCHVGSRSGYCQKIMKQIGFKKVRNFTNGIASFDGEIERG